MGIFDNNFGGTTTVIEEKKSWETQTDKKSPTVSCFVILEHSHDFGVDKKSFDIEILGNKMFTWVVRACPTIPATIEAERGANVLEIVKPYLRDSEYTLVLYSDTPLVTRGSVDEILDYVHGRGLNVCKLTRGYVFKTEYIKRVNEIFAPQTYYFDEEDFIMAVNFKQLSLVSDILKTRIIEYHMKNGVHFENPDLVTIDANVAIGKNTKISGNTRLLGRTEIGENSEISDSIIESCKIFDGCILKSAHMQKSVVECGVCVGSGSKIVGGSYINKNAKIGMNSTLVKSSLGENAEIGHNCFVSSARIHNFAKIGNKCDILGQEQRIVRVLENARLGDGARVFAGVMIGENAVVEEYKQVAQNVSRGDGLC